MNVDLDDADLVLLKLDDNALVLFLLILLFLMVDNLPCRWSSYDYDSDSGSGSVSMPVTAALL